MTAFVALVCFLLIGAGLIFSVLPPLPGPLLSFGSLLLAHFFIEGISFSTTTFWVWGVIVTVIIILDFVLPIFATKKFGGTKAGIYGGVIGLVAGILLPIPFGVIIGPLAGSIIGDLIGGNRLKAAFRSGFGSFLGFLAGTLTKVIVATILGVMVLIDLGNVGLEYIKSLFLMGMVAT